jgi:hypothetical protein
MLVLCGFLLIYSSSLDGFFDAGMLLSALRGGGGAGSSSSGHGVQQYEWQGKQQDNQQERQQAAGGAVGIATGISVRKSSRDICKKKRGQRAVAPPAPPVPPASGTVVRKLDLPDG